MHRLILFFVFFASCSSSLYEQEPNNNFDIANYLHFPFSVTGRINNGMDVDIFKFTVKNDSYCVFSVTSLKGFDTQLEIISSKGNIIKKADDYPRNFGETLVVYLKKGDYFLKLSPSPNDYKNDRPVVISSDEYTLKGDYIDLSLGDVEREPNDTIENANTISISRETNKVYGFYKPIINRLSKGKLDNILSFVSGKINKDITYQDIDVYSFYVKDTNPLLSLKMWLNDVVNYDPIIVLFSEEDYYNFLNNNDKKLYIFDSNSYDKGEGIANLTIKSNKRYYVIVTALARLNYESSDEILRNPYCLTFNLQDISNNYEIEPNNSLDLANPIYSNLVKGFINPVNDIDFYVLNADDKFFYSLSFNKDSQDFSYKAVNFEVSPPKNIDISIEIYSKDGNLLKVIDNGKNGEKEEVPNLLVQKGEPIYIGVKGGKENYEDNYLEEYIIKTRFNENFDTNIEYEVNDKPNQNIKFNTFSDYIYGFINNKGDVDNFYYLVPDTGKFIVSVEDISVPLIVRVYDYKNFLLKEFRTDQSNNSFEVLIPTKQVVRLQIQSGDRNYFNTQKPYKLSIKGGS